MDAKTIAALMAQAERAHMKTADVTAMIEAGKTEAEIRSEIAERACAYADELAKKTAQPAPQKKTAIFDGGDERKIVKEYNLLDVVGGIGADYLCTREGKVEGFDFLMSALCNSKKLYFGNWAEILMCFWSGIDMIVDSYTYSAKGAWQVTAFQDCDVIVRHPAAFAIGTALS